MTYFFKPDKLNVKIISSKTKSSKHKLLNTNCLSSKTLSKKLKNTKNLGIHYFLMQPSKKSKTPIQTATHGHMKKITKNQKI